MPRVLNFKLELSHNGDDTTTKFFATDTAMAAEVKRLRKSGYVGFMNALTWSSDFDNWVIDDAFTSEHLSNGDITNNERDQAREQERLFKNAILVLKSHSKHMLGDDKAAYYEVYEALLPILDIMGVSQLMGDLRPQVA